MGQNDTRKHTSLLDWPETIRVTSTGGRIDGICENCGKKYIRMNNSQRYCGSSTRKEGCSYELILMKQRARNKKMKHQGDTRSTTNPKEPPTPKGAPLS